MAKKHTILTALAMLALLSCAPQTTDKATADSAATAAADPATVRSAIEANNMRGAEALNKGDVEAWLTLFTPDAVVLPPNETAWRGTDGIRAGAQAMFGKVAISGAVLHVEDVKVGGDIAVETGTYEMTATPKGGKPMPDKGKYVTVWQRQADGSWKVIRDIFNSDVPIPGAG